MSDSTERAAVVAWLQDQAEAHSIRGDIDRAVILECAAEAIERGDHIKGDSDDT